MNTGIAVGATKESITAARDAIVKILACNAGDVVTVKALDALTGICSVTDIRVENCTFTVAGKKS